MEITTNDLKTKSQAQTLTINYAAQVDEAVTTNQWDAYDNVFFPNFFIYVL